MTERCVWKAIRYIKNGMVIGLGSGETIDCLIRYIAKNHLKVNIVTLSEKTKSQCIQYGLSLLPIESVPYIDIFFDSCHEVDIQLNALKRSEESYQEEKYIISKAKEFILLVEEKNVYEKLPFHQNVIFEIIPTSLDCTIEQILELEGKIVDEVEILKEKKNLNNNLLIEVKLSGVCDVQRLSQAIDEMRGVIGNSLFVKTVTTILSLDEMHVRTIS